MAEDASDPPVAARTAVSPGIGRGSGRAPAGSAPQRARPQAGSRPARTDSGRLGPLAALALVVAPGLFWGGQVVNEEAAAFLRKYWSPDRTALQKILDVRGWDYYQGRELSYALDYIDAVWVRLLVSRDVLIFLPPSAIAASLAFVAIGAWLAPRALPHLGRATRWLTLLLAMSSFVFASTMGILYRATKPLVGPLLLALLLLALAEHRQPRLSRSAAFWTAFGTSLAMGLLDRQGLFYVLALVGVLSITWLRQRRGAFLWLGASAAVVAWYVYFRFVGPVVIHRVEGYWPSMRFQRLRPARLLDAQLWAQSLAILGDWTKELFGGLPPLLLLSAAAAVLAGWGWRERRRPWRVAIVLGLALVACAAQVAMVAMMVERHPPVAWVSHRLWYYPFPYHVLLVFLLLYALDAAARLRPGGSPALAPLVLGGLVILNLVRWPEGREAMSRTDPTFADQLRGSALLVDSLRSGRAAPLLAADYRGLYFDCLDLFPRLAAHARAQVAEGEGVLATELREGRLTAWAERRAHLVLRTPAPGRYLLAGRARLRQGDTLRFVMGSPPRLLGQVSRPAADGPEPYRLSLELPAGVSDLQLLSELPEVRVPGDTRHRAGFLLELPILLWPDVRR